jgi:hypothetical protein
MYQYNYRSKKYKALRLLVGSAFRICNECGAVLSHPQSILAHTGPVCIENKAKKLKGKKLK